MKNVLGWAALVLVGGWQVACNPELPLGSEDGGGGTAGAAGAPQTGGVGTVDAGPVGPCGDGVLQPEEDCDDGNRVSGDGCSESCTVEPGYDCAVPGTPCECILPDGQPCDPVTECPAWMLRCFGLCVDLASDAWNCGRCGNACAPGAQCVAGACETVAAGVCGNALLEGDEQCDDGNTESGDGCSKDCRLEI